MADTKYTFSKANDFPGGLVNFDTLTEELAPWASGLPNPKTLVRIDSEDDVVDIWFSDPLTQQEEIDLANFVANHDNTVTPEGESVVLDANGFVPSSQLPDMVGATTVVAGEKGAVPAPQAGDHVKLLRGDGTWQELDAADVGADPSGTASDLVAAHEGALDPHPQYTTAAEAAAAASSAVTTHEGAPDPHPGYQRESEKDQANGYAGLTAALKVAASQLQEVIELADLTDVTAKTGAGTTVVMQDSPALTTPTIGDFTNAAHSHQDAAGGGSLNADAIGSGTLARARLPSQVAYEDEANTFSQATDFTNTVRVPRKTTPGSPVQGELYVNGAELQYRDDQGSPANQTVERQSRRGVANGYGSLDGSAQQPLTELKQLVGATSGAAGEKGAAPQPAAGQHRRFLRGDGTWADLTQEFASQSGLATTTSGSDALISGMTLTPEAGTYLLFFDGEFTNTSNNSNVIFSIYVGGVQAPDSEREVGIRFANFRYSGVVNARVTVDGSQTIQVQWRRTSGTAQVRGRSLMLLRVS